MQRHHYWRGRALDRQLRTLYEEKGRLPDMTRLEHQYHRRTTRILIGAVVFLLVLVAASWAGFFLFGPKGGANTEVALSFEGPAVSISGVPQKIIIHYKNRDRDPVGLARLTLRLPKDVLLKDVSPAPDEEGRLTWTLGTLAPRASGALEITATPFGVASSTLTLQAVLTYKPANFNAEFQTVAIYDLTLRDSGIAASLSLPQSASAGEHISFEAIWENRTDETFDGVRAILVGTTSFTLTDSDPALEEGAWNLGTLEPGKHGTISLQGALTGSAKGPTLLAIRFEKVAGDNVYTLGEATATIEVKGGAISAELLLNNDAGIRWVRLGDELGFRLKLTNTSDTSIANASAQVRLASALLDFASIEADGGEAEGGLVRFPKEGSLTIEAGKVRDLLFSVKVVPTALPNISPTIDVQAEALLGDSRITSNPVKVFVVSDLKVASEARYFSAGGQPIGTGPLPPHVGETTSYELSLRLKNTFHDLANIIVTATLPEGVNWLNRTRADTSAGAISYNGTTREVRLIIPRLPITSPEVRVAFDVAVTPKESQRGGLLLLLGVSRAEALDTITQVTFSTDAPSVSSNLDADPQGKGKGVVQ